MKGIKLFIWSLLAEKGEISSKRCIAMSGMVTLIYITIYSQHTGGKIDHYVYGMLVTAVLGAAGITAYEKIKGFLPGATDAPASEPSPSNDQTTSPNV